MNKNKLITYSFTDLRTLRSLLQERIDFLKIKELQLRKSLAWEFNIANPHPQSYNKSCELITCEEGIKELLGDVGDINEVIDDLILRLRFNTVENE